MCSSAVAQLLGASVTCGPPSVPPAPAAGAARHASHRAPGPALGMHESDSHALGGTEPGAGASSEQDSPCRFTGQTPTREQMGHLGGGGWPRTPGWGRDPRAGVGPAQRGSEEGWEWGS